MKVKLAITRIAIFAVALGMVGLSAVGYIMQREDLRTLQEVSKENIMWSAAQLEIELHRFIETIGHLGAGDGNVRSEDVVERFDILWSRVALFGTGDVGERLQRYDKGADVIAATEYVQPCFEIVDSRIKDWKIKISDTVADNASCGAFAVGADKVDPRELNLASLEVVVEKNGEEISRGVGSSVQGAPENAVAWLANTLGAYGIPFEAGEIILSGSLVPLHPAVRGDKMTMTVDGLGRCDVEFV